MSFFPPEPSYPLAIDDDYSLYLVYNTTETILTANNAAWSEEISIRPQSEDQPEIWSDNGFATVEGELLYYDAVEKNADDRVFKLKRCLRNLGGRHTQFNACGTWIRSFVVAEHHTQIVNTILKIEDFVGENFSEDEETLDWRIRNLNNQPFVFDDFNCPDVQFDFRILSSSPNTGTVAEFQVLVQGNFGSVEVQFGDGTSTTQTSGTHNYSPNANIDPAVIVANENCQIVQTPIQRDSTEEPTTLTPVPPFIIPVPFTPDIPSFIFPSLGIPSIDINIPPIVFPCIDLSSIFASLPSLVIPFVEIASLVIDSFTISTLDIPSLVIDDFTISVLDIPSIVIDTFTISTLDIPSFTIDVDFGPVPSFPPITFGPPPSFAPVLFGPAPSFAPITFGPAPTVSVDWGTPPSVTCNCTVTCPSATPFAARAPMAVGLNEIPDPSFDNIEVQYDMSGFPSEIILLPPAEMPALKVDMPSVISLVPHTINIVGPDIPIPQEIRLVVHDIDKVLSLEIPKSAKITLDTSSLPLSIPLAVPEKFPDIRIDASDIPETIKVVGVPEVIRIEHSIPDKITLDVPENLKVPLVFEGPPISGELKVNWGFDKVFEETNDLPCFTFVPCKPR